MEHYFVAKQHDKSEYFTFDANIYGHKFTFTTVNGLFNYHGVDKGTMALLDTLVKCNLDIKGKVLDIGCGLGVIGISVGTHFKGADITMADVNQTAVDVSKINAQNNGVSATIIQSNAYDNIGGTFDWIITNPPIKAGKKVLFDIVLGSYIKLNAGGSIVLVIRKDLGMQSLKNEMEKTFGNCTIINRDKGYYMLLSKKGNE